MRRQFFRSLRSSRGDDGKPGIFIKARTCLFVVCYRIRILEKGGFGLGDFKPGFGKPIGYALDLVKTGMAVKRMVRIFLFGKQKAPGAAGRDHADDYPPVFFEDAEAFFHGFLWVG